MSCALLFSACQSATPPSTSASTTSTLSGLDQATAVLDQIAEENRILTDWINSPEHQAAQDEWEAHIRQKMREYVIGQHLAGEITSGDCPIGETGISIDCGAYDFFLDDLGESLRFAACPGYLRSVGCRGFDESFTDPWRQRYTERTGITPP